MSLLFLKSGKSEPIRQVFTAKSLQLITSADYFVWSPKILGISWGEHPVVHLGICQNWGTPETRVLKIG